MSNWKTTWRYWEKYDLSFNVTRSEVCEKMGMYNMEINIED